MSTPDTKTTPKPCASCGAFPRAAESALLLCRECQHAVDAHGATTVDAYSVPCSCAPSAPIEGLVLAADHGDGIREWVSPATLAKDGAL